MSTSKIRILEKIDRIEKFDKDGGGTIVRTFYVEPYSSHKTLLIALRGTIVKAEGSEYYKRIVPHNDPLFPQYYCFDATCIPFSREAIRGSSSTKFNKTATDKDNATRSIANGQIEECKRALNVVDDFDGRSLIDNLKPAEILAGGVDTSSEKEGFDSKGNCGAFVTATYNPLIFMPGISMPSEKEGIGAPNGPFDFVDPIWTQEVISTAMGRSLLIKNPNPNIVEAIGGLAGKVIALFDGAGLQDTFSKPETIWYLTIKRLMVPYLPKITLGLLSSKLNYAIVSIGNIKFPQRTLCFESAKNELRMGPDGTRWYDLELKFKVRMLYDEGYPTGVKGEEKEKMWIDWNHHYSVPANRITGVQTGECAYYPVGWNSGLWQTFGDSHPLYLDDRDMIRGAAGAGDDRYVDAGGKGTFLGNLSVDLFTSGFRDEQ